MQKILVIKLDHIGDLLLATPVFRSLREQFPNDEIDALVSEKSKAVIENSPFINKIFTYESRDFDRGTYITDQILLNNILTIESIKKEKYDLCIGLREDLSNIPIQKLCGAKRNISFSTNTCFGKYLSETAENDPNKHSAEINYDLLALLDIQRPKKICPEFFIKDNDRKWADDFFRQNHVDAGAIKIGISVGGGWFLNWWPIERFVELGRIIMENNKDVELILVGGKAEEILEERFDQMADYRHLSAVNRTSISQLAALYDQMDFVITNDGGPMHLATSVRTPVIALFGPSPYHRFGPRGEGNTVISKDLSCSPCPQFVQGEPPRCTDNVCMKQITVDEVYEVVSRYIQNARTSHKNAPVVKR